jgi:hypothetical protein
MVSNTEQLGQLCTCYYELPSGLIDVLHPLHYTRCARTGYINF